MGSSTVGTISAIGNCSVGPVSVNPALGNKGPVGAIPGLNAITLVAVLIGVIALVSAT
jgi:hypothetical protein